MHRLLVTINSDVSVLCDVCNNYDHKTLFDNAWNDIKVPVDLFRALSGGMATGFANTTSFELEFSIRRWEMNPNHSNMMNQSLEGILQAKQRAFF